MNGGVGEWVAAQAAAQRGVARWVALELRHDRVYSIFSRMVCGNLQNLAVLGGDAAQILPQRLAPASVHRICVNFPEPPHHTSQQSELSTAENHNHLLTHAFFRAMHTVLVDGGGVTIFGDNRAYCTALAGALAKLKESKKQAAAQGRRAGDAHPLFRSVTPTSFTGASLTSASGCATIQLCSFRLRRTAGICPFDCCFT